MKLQTQRAVAVVGSLNADLVVRVARAPRAGETIVGSSFTRFPGGKGANQACAAGRLARPGLAVRMIGQVGADENGPWLRERLAADGVDVAGVATDEASCSGTAIITVDDAGQNRIVLVAGANGTLSPDRLAPHRASLAGAAVVLLQLESPLDTVIAAARAVKRAGGLVILDPAPARALPDELLACVDYLTPNETELLVVAHENDGHTGTTRLAHGDAITAAKRLRARGARNVLVKLGEAGALLVGEHGDFVWRAFPVVAIDTTAAGDAFNGAFAIALCEGQSVDEAGRFACAAAALSVTRSGAQPSLPTRREVDALLASGADRILPAATASAP